MTELEQQVEEIEALVSIYEGDLFFKQVNSTTFQYKVWITNLISILIKFYLSKRFQYGEEESGKSFMVELVWGKLNDNFDKEKRQENNLNF